LHDAAAWHRFSRQHEGWIASVEIIGADGTRRTEASDLPLQGVSADSPQSNRVDIMIGEQPQDHITHEVPDPVAIAIDQTDSGAERALRIRGRDGSTVSVEFRSPMRADQVDK
jgi:hypothetical protein